ncbi:MAG: mandelate racemase/muconate lactonizing enzyme family protein [Rhodobacteraceae bacterium]|jgi:D-galactarolactone cycloisomerase|uniref:Enolase superfamily enzyme related to L-alanine-DL-glutamate epimerase n=1 Tax=Salipiger profundus TaxID=1229727 RepID=A0A1U7DCR5_9RHOB|nr:MULTISPECIES: mandelate racemase/muconate lactonizing enzyme family protein [Salipiger]APX25902.1 enolase superfamily enzyme related to L-alanine-DL-glutamate epimerase [Salipiger profundus]MAB05075.1 mandelate racemase/muconate lactonizing enzyme family protein [Paracoccaceae bacterium]SFC82168.1 L-alanine-DL-glutamate epimerase [Salipiger profundus]
MAPVARLQAWACRSPIAEPVATSFGIMRNRPAVFLRVEDVEGAFGWGEVFANWPAAGAEHRVNLMADDIAPAVLGREARDPTAVFRTLEAALHIRALQCGEFGPFGQVLAGLDQALWDLAARRAGRPVAQALEPDAPTHVPAYASGIHVDAADRLIPEARATGFAVFKVKVGFSDRDAAKVREIASGLETGERLALDANQAWSPEAAATFLDSVGDLPLLWMEEPIRADLPVANWRRLPRHVPLAGGENIAGEPAFARALSEGVLAVYQPDVAKWGGFTGCMAVGRAALRAGQMYCPHFLGGGIGLAASGHLLAAVGGPGLLEVDVNPNPLRDSFGAIADRVADGLWQVGTAPGIGPAELPEAVRAAVTHHREAA